MKRTWKLPSQRDSERVAKLIRGAFLRIFHRRGWTFFDHGHWWIEDPKTGAQWDAVDASGGRSVNGFDFEQVTRGDEDY